MTNLVARLRDAGLTHEVFNVEEMAADLAERSELNETLETLLETTASIPTPTSFDPGWGS